LAPIPLLSKANCKLWRYFVLTQQQIKNISSELNNHKKEVQILRSEKDTLESVLTMKTADVKKSLSNELVRIEEEM
jgi:hypothetical protein